MIGRFPKSTVSPNAMKRIYSSLSVVSGILLILAMALGLMIDDPASRDAAEQAMVRNHFFASIAGLVFALMLHAIALTYFMGTGRWMEETTKAYQLPAELLQQNQSLKYRMLPLMMLSLVLLLGAAALGGVADPASPASLSIAGMSEATLHLVVAISAIGVHLVACLYEYLSIDRNMDLIEEVMGHVRRLREERGLPV